MKTRRRLLRGAAIAVIGLVIGLSVYSWNARRLVGDRLPMPFGFGVAVVLSGSMEPALAVNDLVVVTAADGVKPGDVVVYQSGGELIIHRVVETDGERLVTRGDANDTFDAPIRADQIKGTLAFSIPFAGLLVRGLQSLPGTLLILLIAGWLAVRSWQKEKAEDSAELERIKEEIRRLQAQTGEAGDAPAEPSNDRQ